MHMDNELQTLLFLNNIHIYGSYMTCQVLAQNKNTIKI